MNRRAYLAATGATLGAVAGCVGTVEEPRARDENGTTTVTPASDETESAALGPTGGSGRWPQLARDARNTSYAPESAGPRREVEVAWKTLGEQSVYRPVVDGDLYLTENWTGGAALSLDVADGTQRWTNASLPPMRWAPALHGDRMLVVTRTKSNEVRLHALDVATGDERWSRGAGVTASASSHPATGPTVADDRVYLGSSTGVLALDAAGGDLVWEAKLDEHVVETDDGPTWRTDWATPAVTDDRVFTFDLNDSYRETRKVYAVDRETGERDWTARIELADGWYLTGHVVAGHDRVFVSALDPHASRGLDDSDWSGTQRLYALDAASGDVEWQWGLSDGKLLGPPAYAEGVLFVGTWNPDADAGTLRAVDASDGSATWTYETDAGGVNTPAVTSEAAYVRQGGELAAVAVEDGSLDWRLPFDDYLSPPIVAADAVYALTGGPRDRDNHVVAVRGR
jgi:outer membrane protein assembly factor BamB